MSAIHWSDCVPIGIITCGKVLPATGPLSPWSSVLITKSRWRWTLGEPASDGASSEPAGAPPNGMPRPSSAWQVKQRLE
jgi:hypothetical protein